MNIRKLEARSIWEFLERCVEQGLFVGSVLDFGCGQQPYRQLVWMGGGEYHGYDSPSFPGSVATSDHEFDRRVLYDTVLCTQVIQYVTDPPRLLDEIHAFLPDGACLVATGPTNWPLVEEADKWRHTPAAVEMLLAGEGFTDVVVEPRGRFEFGGDDRWYLGWQAVARA